jgi:predicted amino acid-binding ACT domain protein
LDVIDEIAGVEQVKVRGADGKERIVRRRLPLSPEEQQAQAQIENIFQTNLGIMEELSSFALAVDIPEFKESLDALRTEQQRTRDIAFREVSRATEEDLARRGLADSTAATQQRAAREVAQREKVAQDERAVSLLAEDLRAQQFGRAQQLAGFAAGRSDVAAAQALQALSSGSQASLGQQQLTGQFQQQSFANQLAASQAQQQAGLGALSSLTSLASLGTLAAGPQGFGFFGTKPAKTGAK